MPRGPILNSLSRNFTTRDSLGIESVANSMSAEICPVVNTVTPRAFYWPFMVWIYYDFYRYSGIENRSVSVFDKYLKRQDYFFVLSVLLTPDSDQTNLVGKQQSQIDLDTDTTGPYPFNEKYFKTRYGGMQYYNAGCLSMGFIIDHDPETDKVFALPKLTKEGESMALAFEKLINNTAYYREYRRNDEPVPKEVLKEYGTIINIALKGFDQCKALLRKAMFEPKRYIKLAQSASLVKLCYEKYGISFLTRESCRQLLFDHRTPSGINLEIPSDLQEIANAWEIVIGRQYFTIGLEMIWKYMLSRLCRPMTIDTWLKEVLTSSDFTWDTDAPVSEVTESCHYEYQVREKMISDAARGINEPRSVESGIRIMLSVYNWLAGRNDFGEEKALLSYGMDKIL